MVSLAFLMLAQAAPAAAATTPVPPATPTGQTSSAANACGQPAKDSGEIVICTERPQGYRINPDVMEARREMKSGGRPVRPGGTIRPDCASVGPAPCMEAGVNLIGAALTAVEMAKRAAEGKEVGSMFLTDPHPTEYQLYQMAKARREAEEADKKAASVKAKAQEAARAKAGAPQPAGN
ncbi:MAG TPA: hypothetical protein VE820_13535 [Sphingomicrobium sp.]|jgi:hypothetical protein|nr:hypothetical protein [Sphingomicrobium sp.]